VSRAMVATIFEMISRCHVCLIVAQLELQSVLAKSYIWQCADRPASALRRTPLRSSTCILGTCQD
jgi:hypothetical protein